MRFTQEEVDAIRGGRGNRMVARAGMLIAGVSGAVLGGGIAALLLADPLGFLAWLAGADSPRDVAIEYGLYGGALYATVNLMGFCAGLFKGDLDQ